jgi:hypothetical protein
MATVTVPTTLIPNVAAQLNRQYLAGEAVTAGDAVYRRTSDNAILKTDANAAASALFFGIAMNSAASGQPVAVQTSGPVNIGGGVAAQTVLVVSPTAGKLMPAEDLAAGDVPCVVGVVLASGLLSLGAVRGDGVIPA